MSRVVLAMSGGVDSSAAALLLQQQGCEVIGLFMRSGSDRGRSLCHRNRQHLADRGIRRRTSRGAAARPTQLTPGGVSDLLDIPFHALNFKDAFGRIKDYFADEYLAGRTPNPCVMCNNWLKFGKLWEFAQQVGADAIASGHYARLEPVDGEDQPALLRGIDPTKDQSYVLFGIQRELLQHIRFPVGGPSEVRNPRSRPRRRFAHRRQAGQPGNLFHSRQ